MLSRIYAFPAYNREPRVFFVDRGWLNQTKQDNGRVFWFMPPGLWLPAWVQLEDDNVIVFRPAAGRPVRVGGVLQTAAGAVELKAPAPFGEPLFPHRPLYGYLMH